MMNRIILIGNGFDLAHGLKTSYKNFIEDYWERISQNLRGCFGKIVMDDLCSITLKLNEYSTWYDIIPHINIGDQRVPTTQELLEEIKSDPEHVLIKKKPLLQAIDTAVETKDWVDIENEYYRMLKQIVREKKPYDCPVGLDAELEVIKTKLVAYLKEIQDTSINSQLAKDCIREVIYAPFDVKDISCEGRQLFEQFQKERLTFLLTGSEREKEDWFKRWGEVDAHDHYRNIDSYKDSVLMEPHVTGKPEVLNFSKHIKNLDDDKVCVPRTFLLPDSVLFLTFNYTRTAELYRRKCSGVRVNHIHGELGNETNPIIFGYGDEKDEDFKRITDLNDNTYLKNFKSYRYLETANYRQLLKFIDSAPYQIYIFGHSCGNSDRTLLHTLFEHRNCVSIKPYYHLKKDGSDDYIDIIQNISRSFNDVSLMRDRVVNKTYCRPLVPPDKN